MSLRKRWKDSLRKRWRDSLRKRWKDLQNLERAGHISNLKRQVPIDLCFTNEKQEIVIIETPTGRCMRYVADFEYRDNKRGCTVLEDYKGMDTPESAIKRAMVKAFYGTEVMVSK